MTQANQKLHAQIWALLKPDRPDMNRVESHLVKLGQNEYSREYFPAVHLDEIPGDVLDGYQKLTTAASHCQAMASASSCSITLSTPDDALADLTRCVEYAEQVMKQAIELSKLIENRGTS